MKHFFAVLAILCTTTAFSQATYHTTGAGNGDWNDTKNWKLAAGSAADSDQDGLPDANDIVVVQAGHTLVVSDMQACQSLELDDDGSFTEMVITKTGNLTVANTLTLRSPLKKSEISVDVMGQLSAQNTAIKSYGGDVNILLDIEPDASFKVGNKPVARLADIAR